MMKRHGKTRSILYFWWLLYVKPLPGKIKRRIWNKHILLWWYRLWIRKDEFHRSLDMDSAAMLEMDDGEKGTYLADLVRRREIAHRRE